MAIISSLLGAANGFVLSRWRFPGADVVFTLILFGMFIPYQAVMIPLRQLIQEHRRSSSGIPTLIVVHVVYGIPICTLIFRNYYATTVPDRAHRGEPRRRRRHAPDVLVGHPAALRTRRSS